MLELVDEDLAFDRKIKNEQETILEKLTNYELLQQVSKQVEMHDQQKYLTAQEHGHFGVNVDMESFEDQKDLVTYNALALGMARFMITLLAVNVTRGVQDPSITIVQSLF